MPKGSLCIRKGLVCQLAVTKATFACVDKKRRRDDTTLLYVEVCGNQFNKLRYLAVTLAR